MSHGLHNSIWIICYESLFDNLYIVKTSHRNDINWSSYGAFFQFSLMAMVCSLYASKLFAPYQRHKHGTHELLIMSRFVNYI